MMVPDVVIAPSKKLDGVFFCLFVFVLSLDEVHVQKWP